jgi:hypothetical protein
MPGAGIAILLAIVVFWLVAHFSVLLAVVAALLVLFGGIGGPYYSNRW